MLDKVESWCGGSKSGKVAKKENKEWSESVCEKVRERACVARGKRGKRQGSHKYIYVNIKLIKNEEK